MFYNAWAPPTETPVSTPKLVYGHYCNPDNIQTILNLDANALTDAVVICKYGGGAGRPDKDGASNNLHLNLYSADRST